MLTRRAKAYPVRKLSVYLQPFRRSSFSECGLQSKIAKINKKTLILKVWDLLKLSILIRLKSSSLVRVVISSVANLQPICNRFHERLANNGKITTFLGYHSLLPLCAGFLELRKSKLKPSKSTFNAEIFIIMQLVPFNLN